MALFGRDYDRDYGYRGDAWGRGYDRGYRPGWGGSNRDDPYLGMTRANRGFGGSMYDRDYGARGYDRGYKSRWQTDHGDPFGDRAAHTPMRMIRGPYHREGYDRGFRGDARYGRDYYEANPMGYDPYGSAREGTWMRGGERGYRPYGRGYDTGWF